MIARNGNVVVGFGENTVVSRSLPPLELRTAYTIKGLGIGAGGLVGYLAGGPLGMIGLGLAGWWAGNAAACRQERKYSSLP